MSTLKLVSLIASVLITTGIITSLASSTNQVFAAQPAVIDGMPVTRLPGITVHASATDIAARPAAPCKRSVAMVDAGDPLSRLIDGAATQVASSHLAMPYYSFGSGIGHISKD